MTQCTQVPAGASGSSAMTASVFADFGIPVHSSGGEIFIPLQVYWCGIAWPSVKAELASFMFVVAGGVCVSDGFDVVAAGCLAQATTNSIISAVDATLSFMLSRTLNS